MVQSDVLRRVPFHCEKWFWPLTMVERERNTLCIIVCSWMGSVWPRHAGESRHYAQCRTLFHIFEWGNVTLEGYCRQIILDHIHLFSGIISPDILFMDDNVHLHRNTETSNTLESKDINCMQCLVYFLNLNPIEHVWWCSLQTCFTNNSPYLNRSRAENFLERRLG